MPKSTTDLNQKRLSRPRIVLTGMTDLEFIELEMKLQEAFPKQVTILKPAVQGCPVSCSDCSRENLCYHPELMIFGRQAIENGVTPNGAFIALVDEEDEQMAVKAATLGALGFVPHKCPVQRLRTTIIMVLERKGHPTKSLAPVMAELKEIKSNSRGRVTA